MDYVRSLIDVTAVGAICWVALRFLLPKWIENHFQEQLEKFKRLQAEELEKYRFEIQKLFNRALKVHEQEFTILPELWNKLHLANGAISDMWGERFDRSYDLQLLATNDLDAFLGSLPYSDNEKQKIKDATDKNKQYRDTVDGHRHFDAEQAFRDLNNYYILNQLFIDSKVREAFDPILDLLNRKLAVYTVNRMSPRSDKYAGYDEKWTQIKPLMEVLKTVIQARLRFAEA